MTREEFLSSFRKTDKLILIVSAVIYFGADKRDALTTLHEMLNTKNERILKHIPNYFNTPSPVDFRDEDFQKFNTDLGFAMDAIRRTNGGYCRVPSQQQGQRDRQAEHCFINEFADLHLAYSDLDKEGKVDMCKSMQEYTLKTKVLTAIESYRTMIDDAEVVKMVVKQLEVSREYVENLMAPVPV